MNYTETKAGNKPYLIENGLAYFNNGTICLYTDYYTSWNADYMVEHNISLDKKHQSIYTDKWRKLNETLDVYVVYISTPNGRDTIIGFPTTLKKAQAILSKQINRNGESHFIAEVTYDANKTFKSMIR